MFATYPIEATEDNWLHDALCEMLETVYHCVESGAKIPTWSKLIPESRRAALKSRRSLRDRISNYAVALSKLSASQRKQVRCALIGQNRIAELLAGKSDCRVHAELPEEIRSELSDLFTCAFGLLTGLGIRDEQYKRIYNALTDHTCPFCGCESFDAPGQPREALDHYLPECKYPCAGANLRNLVPMGNKCNSRFKLAVDPIRGPSGRRIVFDPYGQKTAGIALDRSIPFPGEDGIGPDWIVDLCPECEEVETWDEVFSIRERLVCNVLVPAFNQFLRQFGRWCGQVSPLGLSESELVDRLVEYARTVAVDGLSDRGFLKSAVFEMLAGQCEKGNRRLRAYLLDVVNVGVVSRPVGVA